MCAHVPWDRVPRCAGMGLVWPGSQSHVTFGKSHDLLALGWGVRAGLRAGTS